MIDQHNEQVGIIDTYRARQMAREAGLDLVEVDPNAKPPVCRIQDYGRVKYEKSKRDRLAKQKSHKQELKGIRLRPRIDKHDLSFKVNHAREFILKGDKVQFTMRFRGMREMHHTDLGMEIMRDVAAQLADVCKVESDPRRDGRRITMMVAPLAEIQRRLTAERRAREKERAAKAAAKGGEPEAKAETLEVPEISEAPEVAEVTAEAVASPPKEAESTAGVEAPAVEE